MSHRVTVQTEIKDKDCAIQALKDAKVRFEESGDSLRITSGPCSNAVINLKTGEVSGDTDYRHNTKELGLLRQMYAEAKFKAELFKTGGTVDSRNVDRNGDVVFMHTMQA